jgi:signal transduction histidine kinase
MALASRSDTVAAVAALAGWASRDDDWWAGVAGVIAVIIGAVSVVPVASAPVRLEVAGVSLIVSAAFLARRRWPSLPTPALVGWTFAPPLALNLVHHAEGTLFLVVLATTYVALSESDGRYRVAALVIALAIPPIVAVNSSYSLGWPYWMMGITFGWVTGIQTRRFRLLVTELQAARQQLADQAVFAERRRIASELHDLVGHSLTVVLLFLTGARRRVKEDPAGADDALREAEEIGRRSLAEIRANVAALRSGDDQTPFRPIPTVRDLPGLITQVRAAGTSIGLELRGPLDDVEAITGMAVYRVVQESLANATKHAPGAAVQVRVAADFSGVRVEVVNNCSQLAPPHPETAGMGLIGMRERVETLGGQLEAGPQPALGGWRVKATIPKGPTRS